MAKSICGKWSFEVKKVVVNNPDTKKNTSLYFVQCSRCGSVISVLNALPANNNNTEVFIDPHQG